VPLIGSPKRNSTTGALTLAEDRSDPTNSQATAWPFTGTFGLLRGDGLGAGQTHPNKL